MKSAICILLLLSLVSYSQVNLVPNSSFEQCLSCSSAGGGSIGYVDVIQWFNPNTASPDYHSAVNYPPMLNQNIPDGQAFIGMATYDGAGTNIREYISCNLLDTLQDSQYYWVEFYASVGEVFARFAANNLGLHFSDTALHSTTPYYFDVEAQVKYFNNEIIEDTVNWIKVSGLYQAQGGEQFLTIGNFNPDAETNVGMEYTDGVVWQAYYIIDDVSVIPLDSIPGGIPVDAGPDKTIYIGDTTFIGQKISNMPDMWFEFNGTPLDTNTAGVYVSPTVNTTYVVTRNLNGFYSTDTVTVFVNGLGLEEDEPYLFTLSPNPSEGCVFLKGEVKERLSADILSADGKMIFREFLSVGTFENYLQTNLSAGSYFLLLRNEQSGVVFRTKLMVK